VSTTAELNQRTGELQSCHGGLAHSLLGRTPVVNQIEDKAVVEMIEIKFLSEQKQIGSGSKFDLSFIQGFEFGREVTGRSYRGDRSNDNAPFPLCASLECRMQATEGGEGG
jgi:hypothetical protein